METESIHSSTTVVGTIRADALRMPTKNHEEFKMNGHASKLIEETFLRRLLSSKASRNKLCRTLWIYFDYFAFEWLFGTVGPSLPDLQEIVHVDLKAGSWIITCFFLGYMAGCALHGFLYDRINNVLLCAVYAATSGLLWIVTPLCQYYWLLLVVRFLAGTAWGCTDSGAHSELYAIWGAEAGPFSQLLYVAAGLGGMVSTYVTKLFLETPAEVASAWNSSIKATLPETTMSPFYGATLNPDTSKSSLASVVWPYFIAGCVSILASIPLFTNYIQAKCFGEEVDITSQDEIDTNSHEASVRSRVVYFSVMILLSAIVLILTGMIDTYVNFGPTFTLLQMGWEKKDGALASTVFFIAFVIGNVVCVLLHLVLHVPTGIVLMSALIGSALALTGVVASGLFQVNAGLWVFDVACGLFMSPLWPAFYTYVEENVTPVAGKVASVLLFFGAAGMTLNPLLVGYTMGALSPIWYGYSLLAECVSIIGLFAMVSYLYRSRTNVYESI